MRPNARVTVTLPQGRDEAGQFTPGGRFSGTVRREIVNGYSRGWKKPGRVHVQLDNGLHGWTPVEYIRRES